MKREEFIGQIVSKTGLDFELISTYVISSKGFHSINCENLAKNMGLPRYYGTNLAKLIKYGHF